MRLNIVLLTVMLLVAAVAFADPDADAVLEQARREYQEAVGESANAERADEQEGGQAQAAEQQAQPDPEGRQPATSGSVYRYERHTTESESWSMESPTEPDWWTEGVDNDEPEGAAPAPAQSESRAAEKRSAPSASSSARANRAPTEQTATSPESSNGFEMRDFRPEPPRSARPAIAAPPKSKPGPRREVEERKATFVPVHVSVFGEQWGNPISTNIAVSPLISSVHSVNGIQGGGVIATVEDGVRGFQLAGVLATSEGEVHGMQSAGVFVTAEGDVYGLQSAGVFSVGESDVSGIQSAGVFNSVGGDLNGVQTAGVFNSVDGSVRGMQAAGVFNTAGNVKGGQVGIVNVADDVHGVQIGLVNVSENMYGLPIGLINIVRNGIRNFTVWFEDTGYNYVGYQYGSNIFYTLAYGGLHKDDWFESYDSLVTGLGLGMRIKLGGLYIDADVSAKHVAAGETGSEKLSKAFAYDATTYPAARLVAGLSLGRRLSIFAGADFDIHLPGYTQRGLFHTGRMIPVSDEEFTAELYPKYFVGFSF